LHSSGGRALNFDLPPGEVGFAWRVLPARQIERVHFGVTRQRA
jgi:hypothetical protein